MKSTLFCLVILMVGFTSANPLLLGNWEGFVVQNYQQKDNAIYLPCLINISSITETQIAGTIEIDYKHSNGKTYKSKSNIKGDFDAKAYTIGFVSEDFIFQDILPEKLKWCLGIFNGGIYRSKTAKQYLFKGMYQTKCNANASLLVVYKK